MITMIFDLVLKIVYLIVGLVTTTTRPSYMIPYFSRLTT